MSNARRIAARRSIVPLMILSLMALETRASDDGRHDCHRWLEEIDSDRARDWVRAQNRRTLETFEAHPLHASLLKDARDIVTAQDRLPKVEFRDGYFWNSWDGVWRRTTYDQFRTAAPNWETILDVNDLSARESENWVFDQAPPLAPGSPRRLMMLSRGGRDAVVVREFDVDRRSFVEDGFNLPEAKTAIAALGPDEVLVATDEGPDSLTNAEYPRVVRRWSRGQKLADAPIVFTGAKTDYGAHPFVMMHGNERYAAISQAVSYYENKIHLVTEDGRLETVPLPALAKLIDIYGGHVFATLREPFVTANRTIPAGSLIRSRLTETDVANATVLFTPNERQSIRKVHVMADRVVLNLIDNVRGKIVEIRWADGVTSRTLPFPDMGTLNYTPSDENDPTSFAMLDFTNHLTPKTLYRVRDENGGTELEELGREPAHFDASDFDVEQHFATSLDGTRVPYFIVKKKDLVRDGSNPTLLYGYGGFEVPLVPRYNAVNGKLWLERGGVFVVANIRGGGEFGPGWHRAALGPDRQRAYEDFIAVAQNLCAHRVTSPSHLGIWGRSNGGLLVGSVMVQRPDLFRAARMSVPLLDMLRFAKLLAGASWIGEFGDPEIPADRAYLGRRSPYQNLRAGVRYPTPLVTTTTLDDRVHPGHARKMVARMLELGHPAHFFESDNGGHAGGGGLEDSARMYALKYAYFWERLGGSAR